MHSEREVGFEYGKMIGRSLILGHRLDHLVGEQFRHGADADDAGRPIASTASTKVETGAPVLRERLLEIARDRCAR